MKARKIAGIRLINYIQDGITWKSHKDVMKLAESLSEEQLFTKGMYPWVGSSVLGSYFVSCLSSHYDWAMKKLKAHKKNCEKAL